MKSNVTQISVYETLLCPEDIVVNEAIFRYEMDEYYDILKGGEKKVNDDDFFAPVFVIDATIRAIASGNVEIIAYN